MPGDSFDDTRASDRQRAEQASARGSSLSTQQTSWNQAAVRGRGRRTNNGHGRGGRHGAHQRADNSQSPMSTSSVRNSRHDPGTSEKKDSKGRNLYNVTWARTPGLQSTASARKMAFDQEQAARDAQLACTSPSGIRATAYYLWPDHLMDARKLLGNDLDQLKEIGLALEVYIDWQPDLGAIRIRSEKSSPLDQAIRTIQTAVGEAEARFHAEEPVFLVAPPTVEGMKTSISKVIKDTGPAGPVVVSRVVLDGRKLTSHESSIWAEQRAVLLVEQEVLITGRVKAMLKGSSLLQDGLKFRVQFGRFEVTEYKKDFLTGNYTYSQFLEMMASRGKASLNRDPRTFLSTLQQTTHLFEPFDFATTDLKDTPAKQCLQIKATKEDGSSLQIECDIDKHDDSGHGVRFSPGSSSYYHDRYQGTRMSIGVLNLETRIDWSLLLLVANQIKRPGTQLRSLAEMAVAGFQDIHRDEMGCSYPSVVDISPTSEYHVDTIILRNSWEYKLQGSDDHVFEVAMYRTLPTGVRDQVPAPHWNAGMYCPSWDADTGPRESLDPRVWSSDLADLLDEGSYDDRGFLSFIGAVRRVQEFIDGVLPW